MYYYPYISSVFKVLVSSILIFSFYFIIKTITLFIKNRGYYKDKIRLKIKFPFTDFFILVILTTLLKFLSQHFYQSYSELFFGFIIFISILLLLEWCYQWKIVQLNKEFNLDKVSKKYDIQFKRLAKYLLFVFLLYILYGVIEFKEKNKGYYLREITISNSLANFGYNTTTFRQSLQEIYEGISDYEFRNLMTGRYAFDPIPTKESLEPPINFEIQGFGFPLKNIGSLLAEKLWGDNKRYIDISVIDDSVKLIASITITKLPTKTIELFFENYLNKDIAIHQIMKEIQYYIMEPAVPDFIANYYLNRGQYDKANLVLVNNSDTSYWGNFNFQRTRSIVFKKLYEYEISKRVTDTLLKKYPVNIILLNDRGTIEELLSNNNNAQKYYIKALAINSISHYPCTNRATYFYKVNNLDSSLFYFKRSLLDTNYYEKDAEVSTLFKISYIYRLKRDLINSEKYFIEACNSSPYTYEWIQNLWPLFPFGDTASIKKRINDLYKTEKDYVPGILAYAVMENHKLGTSNYQDLILKCIKKYPNLILAQMEMLKIYSYKRDFRNGDSVFKRIIANQPDNYVAYCFMGLLDYLDGNSLLAEKYYKTSMKINKFFWVGFQNLAFLLRENRREKELSYLLYNYYEDNQYDPVCNFLLGESYYLQNDLTKALTYFLSAEKYGLQPPNLIELYGQTADCYFELRQYYSASKYYEKINIENISYTLKVKVLLNSRQCYIQLGEYKKKENIDNILKQLNLGIPEQPLKY